MGGNFLQRETLLIQAAFGAQFRKLSDLCKRPVKAVLKLMLRVVPMVSPQGWIVLARWGCLEGLAVPAANR